MRKIMMLAAVAALAACSQEATAPEADENIAVAETEAPAEMSFDETSWEYTEDDKLVRTSIDANGNYESNSGDEHVDHGQFAVVDGKACFTSAMNEDGQVCWTASPAEIGESIESTNDQGETLTVTRVEYTPFEPRA